MDRDTGALASAVSTDGDVAPGTELLAGGVRPVLVSDDSDTWSHGIARYDGPEEAGRLLSVEAVERGPVRATVRSVWSFGDGRTTVAQDVSLLAGSGGAEVRLDVDWHEEHRVLKLVVPLALDQPSSTAGAPYGSVGRPCSGHEEPMVHWVDLSGAAAGWGVACLTEGAGGYDARDATLRLTVLRSPRVADHGRGWGAGDAAGYPFTDQGRHRARYALVPHAGPAAGADLPRHAAEHRAVLPVVLDTWHRGRLGPEGSAVHLEGEGVLMPVLKRAEDGGGTVARLWEVAGSHRRVRLSLGPTADQSPNAWGGELRPHEVRTVFVPDGDPTGSRTVDIPELDVRRTAAPDFSALAGAPSRARHRPAAGRGGAGAPGPHRRGGRDRLRRGQRRQRGRRRAHRGRADEGHGASAPPRGGRPGLLAGSCTELHDGRGRLPGRAPGRCAAPRSA